MLTFKLKAADVSAWLATGNSHFTFSCFRSRVKLLLVKTQHFLILQLHNKSFLMTT